MTPQEMILWIAEKDAKIRESAEAVQARLAAFCNHRPIGTLPVEILYLFETLAEPATIGNKLSFEPGDYTCTWYAPPLKAPEVSK